MEFRAGYNLFPPFPLSPSCGLYDRTRFSVLWGLLQKEEGQACLNLQDLLKVGRLGWHASPVCLAAMGT